MTHVVFTGAATDRAGDPVLRKDLQLIAEAAGFTVLSSAGPKMELLVASRFDTRKARAALEKGVKVMSYPAFIDQMLGGIVQTTGVEPDPYVDAPTKKTPLLVDEAKGLKPYPSA